MGRPKAPKPTSQSVAVESSTKQTSNGRLRIRPLRRLRLGPNPNHGPKAVEPKGAKPHNEQPRKANKKAKRVLPEPVPGVDFPEDEALPFLHRYDVNVSHTQKAIPITAENKNDKSYAERLDDASTMHDGDTANSLATGTTAETGIDFDLNGELDFRCLSCVGRLDDVSTAYDGDTAYSMATTVTTTAADFDLPSELESAVFDCTYFFRCLRDEAGKQLTCATKGPYK